MQRSLVVMLQSRMKNAWRVQNIGTATPCAMSPPLPLASPQTE